MPSVSANRTRESDRMCANVGQDGLRDSFYTTPICYQWYDVINIKKNKDFIITSQAARFVGNESKLYINKSSGKMPLP